MDCHRAGNPKPQLMPEDRAKDLKSCADFDGLLYHWKEKGHIVELVGRDTIEKSSVYKLKITKKDGGVEFLFLDAAKFYPSEKNVLPFCQGTGSGHRGLFP